MWKSGKCLAIEHHGTYDRLIVNGLYFFENPTWHAACKNRWTKPTANKPVKGGGEPPYLVNETHAIKTENGK